MILNKTFDFLYPMRIALFATLVSPHLYPEGNLKWHEGQRRGI